MPSKKIQDMNACVPTLMERSRSSASASWRSACGAFVGGRWTRIQQSSGGVAHCKGLFTCVSTWLPRIWIAPSFSSTQFDLVTVVAKENSGWTADTSTASTEHPSLWFKPFLVGDTMLHGRTPACRSHLCCHTGFNAGALSPGEHHV